MHSRYKRAQKVKIGCVIAGTSLVGLSAYQYRIEQDALKQTAYVRNAIALRHPIQEQYIAVSGVLENVGGSYGSTGSDVHYYLHISKPGKVTPPIRVVVSFDGYNPEASKMGDRYNAIVTGIIRKEDPSHSYLKSEYVIGGEGNKGKDVEIRRMFLHTP